MPVSSVVFLLGLDTYSNRFRGGVEMWENSCGLGGHSYGVHSLRLGCFFLRSAGLTKFVHRLRWGGLRLLATATAMAVGMGGGVDTGNAYYYIGCYGFRMSGLCECDVIDYGEIAPVVFR